MIRGAFFLASPAVSGERSCTGRRAGHKRLVPFGINIRAEGDASSYWELVDRASALEDAPTIRSLGYPPHITLAKYDTINEANLLSGLEAIAACPKVTLAFSRIGMLDTGLLILWAEPEPHPTLTRLHARVHGAIDPALSKPAYRPGAWLPHCSIALRVSETHREAARELAANPLVPFSLTFEVADCVAFPPVAVLAKQALR